MVTLRTARHLAPGTLALRYGLRLSLGVSVGLVSASHGLGLWTTAAGAAPTAVRVQPITRRAPATPALPAGLAAVSRRVLGRSAGRGVWRHGHRGVSAAATGSGWTQLRLSDPCPCGPLDQFGSSVAVSGDTAVVGAQDKQVGGHLYQGAYVFVRHGITWTQQAELTASDGTATNQFGWSVALSGDGNTALVGAPYRASRSGIIFVYVRHGAT